MIDNINIKKDTDTVSRYIVNYHIRSNGVKDALKIEVSYRTPVKDEEITIKNGIRFASVERIIDNKLRAAYDGDNTRTKGRDLFNLHFLAKNYPDRFDSGLAVRLKNFTQNPDKLADLYREDIEADPLLNKIMDMENIVLELNQMAEEIYLSRQIQNHSAAQESESAEKTSSKENTQNIISSPFKIKL